MASIRMESEAFEEESLETCLVAEQPASEPAGREAPARSDRPAHPFRALKHRNFQWFWSGQLISLLGTWAQNLAQGWLIILLVDPVARQLLRHGGAPTSSVAHTLPLSVERAANYYSGWVNFCGGLPIFLFSLLAGVVADRVSKRKMLLVTQSALIACALGLGLLCVTGRVELWQVMFFAALSGVAAAFDMPTRQAFVVDLVGREDLPSAIALNSSVFNAARAIGPAIAGLLLAANISIGSAFLGNAFLSLAVIVGLLLIRIPDERAAVASPAGNPIATVWPNMVEGFRYVVRNHTARNLVLLVGVFGTFAFSFNVLIPVFVRFTLLPHATDAVQVKAFGFMETVRGIGALAGALTVAFLGSARRQRNMLITGSLLATVVLVIFALTTNLWVAYATMIVVSYGFVLCFATANTLMQLTVPDELRGRAMSIYTLMFIGTMPFGSLFAGWLAKYIGAPPTIFICAVVSLLTTLIVTFRRGGLREIAITSNKPVRAAV